MKTTTVPGSKKASKKEANSGKKVPRVPKQGTIGHIVLSRLRDKADVTTEELLPVVLAKFPESRFGKSHLAWYRHQVKMGHYGYPTKDAVAKTRKTKKLKAGKKPEAKPETAEAKS